MAEVREALGESVAYTTVLKILQILEEKGAVERVRRERPEESFTVSLRTGWDVLGMDPDLIRRERDERWMSSSSLCFRT